MRLNHFTSEESWPEILATGEIICPAEQQRRDPSRVSDWFYKTIAAEDALVEQFAEEMEKALEAGAEWDAAVAALDQSVFSWADTFPEIHDTLVFLTTGSRPPRYRPDAIRMEVELDDVRRWRSFAHEKGIPRQITETMGDTGPGSFYVAERPIPKSEWIRVERTATGEVLFLEASAT